MRQDPFCAGKRFRLARTEGIFFAQDPRDGIFRRLALLYCGEGGYLAGAQDSGRGMYEDKKKFYTDSVIKNGRYRPHMRKTNLLIKGLVGICHSLGIKIVAEGRE